MTKAKFRELWQQCQEDIALAQKAALEMQRHGADANAVLKQLWEGLELGDDMPEYEVEVRVRNVS